jgi:subtilisin family serine protease/cytochrome c553
MLGLLLSARAPAGAVDPRLRERLAELAPGDEVPVIVRFAQEHRFTTLPREPLSDRRARLIRTLRARADRDQAEVRDWLARRGAPHASLWLADAIATTLRSEDVDALATRSGVESVRLDAAVPAPEPGSGAGGSPPEWNLAAIRAPELWQLGFDGEGVVVATLDTGVDPLQPDLAERFRGGANSWFDPHGEHATPHDGSGHGTQVMGLLVGGDAGGSAVGVAPGARWIAAKIFDDRGEASWSAIHRAFQWTLDPDGDPASDDAADVVNGSWGLLGTLDACETEFEADLAGLRAAGIAVVFAAGNFGPGAFASVSPANNPGALAVGAVDPALDVASFSSRGPSACDGGIYPRVAAPGVAVLAPDLTFGGIFPDSYASVSGTSFAAPHVSGALALLRSAEPEAPLDALEAALVASAVDRGAPGPDHEYGHGVVDVVEAYRSLLEVADGDGDGLADADDLCPADRGVPGNLGCPSVTIDVLPGDASPAPGGGRGKITVAILASGSFDAVSVEAATVCFGASPPEASASDCSEAHGRGHPELVDGDDLPDLVLHYDRAETGITSTDRIVCLTGETGEGSAFRGCDAVRSAPRCGLGLELVLALPPLGWLRRRRRVRSGGGTSARLAAALLAVATGANAQAADPPGDGAELGRGIYRTGRLPSGEPLRATAQGDVPLEGAQAACTTCHGRSGLGYGEGTVFPPAIAGPALYRARRIERRELYGARSVGPGTRPAYTDASLARAIREGTDPAGRVLDPLMPRYALGDEDLAALVAYLRSLGARPAAGVTESTIHFATVVGEGVDPLERRSMIGVLEAFLREKNAETRREDERARYRNIVREWDYRAYREWALHVWELGGPPDTWGVQLEAHYARQPVFALVSGIASGSWRPVHEFCERREVPCLFPHTLLPVASEGDFYTLYFSEGVRLESQVLARHLRVGRASESGIIVSVHRDPEVGRVAAAALGPALDGAGCISRPVRLESAGASASFWRELVARERPSVLILWLGPRDLETLGAVPEAMEGVEAIYLSSSLVPSCAPPFSGVLRARTFCVHPFALPGAGAAFRAPFEAWLGRNGLELGDERVQIGTYLACRALGEGLMHISGNFSREYLVERIEHRLGALVSVSPYPLLGLGAGQRFASKGAYVVRPAPEVSGGLAAVSGWIVP